MIILNKITFSLALLAFSGTVLAQSPSDYSWKVSDANNVSTINWTANQIGTFLTAVTQADEPLIVGAFQFVNLLGDDNLESLATTDPSGRGFFNDLLVTSHKGSKFSMQRIPVMNIESLVGILKDINGDGKQEIIVPEALTPYLNGPTPQLKWTAIYTWTGSFYEERTALFSTWYIANILPGLQHALISARQNGDPVAIAQSQLQLDKAIRLSGGAVETGIVTAQILAVNGDPILRIWAAYALADIGTPTALTSLAMLVNDSDPSVASYAQTARKQAAQDHCDHVSILIRSEGAHNMVNIGSNEHVKVIVKMPERRNDALDSKSATFGENGYEQSLIKCETDDRELQCKFRASQTALEIGDGVATFRANRRDGRCVIGRGVVQVVNIPDRD